MRWVFEDVMLLRLSPCLGIRLVVLQIGAIGIVGIDVRRLHLFDPASLHQILDLVGSIFGVLVV